MQLKVEENIAEVVRTTRPEDKELLTKMRKLISTNEKIKKQESEFRLACKGELGMLEARNGAARSRLKEVTALDAGSEEGAKLRFFLFFGGFPRFFLFILNYSCFF